MQYGSHLVDIRDLDGETLLESDAIGDNVLAILARVRNRKDAIRRVLGKIVALEPSGRARIFRLLMVLSGLRKIMSSEIAEEATHMPILNDINDHEVMGREYKRGVQGGELRFLLTLLEDRFGSVPSRIREVLGAMSPAELERVGVRLLRGISLDHLFDAE